MSSAIDARSVEELRTNLIRIARRIDRQVSIGGLTSTDMSVLATIANRGPIGLTELAAYEGINPTMLSRVVGKLESADFVRREVSSADRRAIEVVATRKGRKRREQLLAERTQLIAERLGELPPGSVAKILDASAALGELAAALVPRGNGSGNAS
ncbi:MAG: MarR family transcriptional regulator [Actinobacteria bacterium]|nr:MarR family transcriptional regulator [Actinomycetota bacterium]